MKVNRGDRLASSFKKVIYEIITQKLKNPFITEMVSIIKIDVSKDMSHAKVYLSVYSKNEERKQRTFDEIVKSTKPLDTNSHVWYKCVSCLNYTFLWMILWTTATKWKNCS